MSEKKSLDEMTLSEIENHIETLKREVQQECGPIRKKKPKMKTGKKALWVGMWFCIVLIVFSMVMIVIDKDTNTTSILGGAGVAAIPFMFGIYEKYSTEISLKNMEENYIENYDEKMGIY